MSRIIIYILLFTAIEANSSNVMFLEPVNITALNSSFDEFAPSWNAYEDILYYTSNRTGNEKLYISTENADGFLEQGKYLESPINQIHQNISYIDFISNDKAYFSSFVQGESQPILQLFYTNYKKQTWSEGFELAEFESEKFKGQSSISPDLNQLVFTSQSEDGDLDLYISYRFEDGSWKEPIDLDYMNSIGNEITPHFASNDTLYFASDGQGGPGGYDIYYSVKVEGNWQRPSPLYEINSEYNESDICTLPNGDLIFSSDRPGGIGGLDLWLASSGKLQFERYDDKPLEISLQSYITNITIINNYEYENLPISNTLYLKDSTMILPDMLFEYKQMNELQGLETIEESYSNSLNFIGSTLRKNDKAKLKITAYYPGKLEIDTLSNKNSKYYADLNIKKIYDFLTQKFNISESQIVYSYDFYKDESHKPAILLSSPNTELFSELEIREDNIKIEQRFLPIDVKIEPENQLSHWLAVVNIDGSDNIVYENNSPNERFTLDLTRYRDKIFDFDNLEIKIKAFNLNGDSVEKIIPHNIEHRFTKKPKLIAENGMYIEYHYLFGNRVDDMNSKVYEGNLDKIINSMSVCKSIEIKYNKHYNLAKQLHDKLQTKVTSKQLNVKLSKFDGYVSNDLLDDNLIIIKIGKYPLASSNN